MNLQFNLYQLILASGVVYGLLLSFMILWKGLTQRALFYLAVALLSFSLLNWRILIISTHWAELNPLFSKLSFVPTLAIMPSLYGYVLSLAGEKLKPQKLLLHYLPFVVHFIYQLLRFAPDNWKETFLHGKWGHLASWFITLILIGQILLYSKSIFKIIGRHEEVLKHHYSDLGTLSLAWIKRLMWFILFVFACSFVFMMVSQFYGKRIVDFQWFFVILSVFIYWVGTEGLSKGVFYQHLSLPSEAHKSVVDPEDRLRAEKLINLISERKLYLQNQLSLGEVALEAGMSNREVSYLINQVMGKNFYQLMNQQRLEEFLRLSEDPSKQHFSLLGLALEAGFNSKSVFNDFFKKQLGTTPRQYVESRKKKS